MHKDSITTQHHNVKVLRSTVEHTEVVETELRVESTINVILIDRRESLVLNPRRKEEGDSDQKVIR